MIEAPLYHFIAQCATHITTGESMVVALFMAGIVGSFTHCIGMCGPFVLSQSRECQKLSQHLLLPYHMGRITTYICMGIILASLTNIAFIYAPIRAYVTAPILMVAGLVFLVMAFPQLRALFPWVTAIRPPRFMQKIAAFLSQRLTVKPFQPSIVQRYVLGVSLGFLPCGLVMSALLVAAMAPRVIDAGVAMAAFGLGTLPGLFFVAVAGKKLQVVFPRFTRIITKTMMIWSACILFAIGFTELFF